MRILLLIISFFCLAATVAAKDVYRYVDEQGNVIYSDTPVPGAEKIRVEEVQTIPPGEVPEFKYTPQPKEVPFYTRLEIINPENDSVIRTDEGKITVNAIMEPQLNLREGHYLALYLDGAKVASGTRPTFELSDMERGTHTLSIAVVDQSGNQVISSPDVTFTIYQHSVLHPGPTSPPPPPPKPPVP